MGADDTPWYKAASRCRCIFTLIASLFVIIASIIVTASGVTTVKKWTHDGRFSGIWKMGFGEVKLDARIDYGQPIEASVADASKS
ncbi:hypothetical protein B0J14DRAFT_662764 [Halenospora varia]|nr:hypothetical protein B0J14DRAFT_662764 [Halenospora varia]